MEPSLFAIDKAVRLTIAYLGEAQKHAADDANACREFLNAAIEAVKGLEAEYDEIINQARIVDLHSQAERNALKARVGSYLGTDLLRPELIRAIAGLKECRHALEQRVASVWQWPWKVPDREQAIQQFAQSLGLLENYLRHLEAAELPYRRAQTGVGYKWLLEIEAVLKSQLQDPDAQRRQLDLVLRDADADRDKNRLVTTVGQIAETATRLVQTFR